MSRDKPKRFEKPPILPFMLPDRFGLPYPSLLGDTKEAKSRRAEAVRSLITDLFKTAVIQLGEEEARRLFASATKRKRGKHGKSKGLAPDRDSRLLAAYFTEAARMPDQTSTIPRRLAERFYKEEGTRFGASASALERHIRRLLENQRRLATEIAKQFEQW